MMRYAAIAAVLAASTPAAAQATAGFSLRQWSQMEQRERRIMIVAAIEGLMLAVSGKKPEATGLDASCLSLLTFEQIEGSLHAAAAVDDGEFIDKLVEVSECSRS